MSLSTWLRDIIGVNILGGSLTESTYANKIIFSGFTISHDAASDTATIAGGGSGVGWDETVRTTAAAYNPTEAEVLAGLTIAAGRNDTQSITLPDITTTPTKSVVVTIYGYDGNISPTNVVTVMGTSVDADTAFIDHQGDSLMYKWMLTGWVLL